MNKLAMVLFSLAVASNSIAVTCAPMNRHLLAKPSPALPSPAPPWPDPPSPAPPSEALERDKTPLDQQATTMHETSQEEKLKSCQTFHNSTDYFVQPVLDACLPCSLCVNNDDSYCGVCNTKKPTVPSLVDIPSTPKDSSDSFLDSTTNHQETSVTESMITDDKKTTDDSSTSSVNLVVLWIVIVILVILVVGFFVLSLFVCVIKRNKGVADTPPAVMAQAISATPEEELICLDNINNDNVEAKSQQDTQPVPSFHPMAPNSYESSYLESTV